MKSYWDDSEVIERRIYRAHVVQAASVGPDNFVGAWQALHGW